MTKFKNYILIGTCGVLAAVSVLMTIETATSNVEMENLQKNEAKLLSQKRELEENLVKTMSVSELQGKSIDLGFVKPQNLVYVAGSETVAKLP